MVNIMSSKSKISSIELGRIIAMLVILAMHCQMFLSYWQTNEVPWFGYIFNQITRFAVPLFFIISGYFIYPKLINAPFETMKSYSKPLFKVWLVWSILSLVMPFNLGVVAEHGYLAERQGYWGYLMQAPLNTLLEGGLVHLWYIPALICAVSIMAFLINTKQTSLIIPVGVVLYGYGVLAGSYQVVTELEPPFFTRNGPFFATLMVGIGFTIRQLDLQWSSSKALLVTMIGLIMHFSEAAILHGYGQPFNSNDFLVGTAIWGMGCFMWLLSKPNLGNSKLTFSLSKRILPIYVSHLLVIILMNNLVAIAGLADFTKDMAVFIGSLTLTYLLVIGIEKTPLNKLLFR
ncbi:acyltransferase family protein [uncultured Vibrio sp.]|mgnify:CR=1 FL=1|uniref:acyltransferase family protein n=1 Tax=uncultured Vibrio sp. TaxID=114054 RepID=UPI0025EB0125|nr:acyltransferase family protein [uncultured Vibrio sp.]